jgi:hypothetical protein
LLVPDGMPCLRRRDLSLFFLDVGVGGCLEELFGSVSILYSYILGSGFWRRRRRSSRNYTFFSFQLYIFKKLTFLFIY